MSRPTDILTASVIARHCQDPQCRKCRARGTWFRRKAWHSRKSTNRTRRDRRR